MVDVGAVGDLQLECGWCRLFYYIGPWLSELRADGVVAVDGGTSSAVGTSGGGGGSGGVELKVDSVGLPLVLVVGLARLEWRWQYCCR